MKSKLALICLLAAGASSSAFAQTYTIDPSHTYPSFEAAVSYTHLRAHET